MSILFSSPHLTRNNYFKLSRALLKCLRQNSSSSVHSNQGFSSQTLHENSSSKSNKFMPFANAMNYRKQQANKSILVQVQSSQSYKELYAYCSTIGSVKHMLHFTSGVEPLHFIIVEFSNVSDVKKVLTASTYMEETQIVPVQSVFLWFKASTKRLETPVTVPKGFKLLIENGTEPLKDDVVKNNLQNASSISKQITMLHEMTRLNDVGTRLRFLVAKQIESALSGMFPSAIVHPFGSSVNGYGRMGCDLDLTLRLNESTINLKDGNRLVFHCKEVRGSERSTAQRYMETIGDILQLFLPGCSQIRRILQARVPIIKYYHQFADVECDLSMINMSGVYMSEFLYLMGEIDDRVRPLVFMVKRWANEVGLTNSHPGRWVTNFSLTLMVIAFLQQKSSPIVPTLNELVKLAGPKDVYTTEDGISCTFLRDLNKLNFKKTNSDSLESLLRQFFEYYCQFDFESRAICLNDKISPMKPEHSPLYIVNPLERGLNVSKNVSLEELVKLKLQLRNAAWALESQECKTSNWGVLSMFKNNKVPSHWLGRQKLIEVSELFNDDVQDKSIEDLNVKKEATGSRSRRKSK